jgi:hypothetical protein
MPWGDPPLSEALARAKEVTTPMAILIDFLVAVAAGLVVAVIDRKYFRK